MYQRTQTNSILRISDGACIPPDPANSDYQTYLQWAAAGNSPLPYVPPALTVADFDTALTEHLDATAQARQYDNRITCMVRAGFPGPFQVEAIAFATWCDSCNMVAYGLMSEVAAGTRPLPDTTQALIDVLPVMVWPE